MKFCDEMIHADDCMQKLDAIFDNFIPPMTIDVHNEIMCLLKDLESIRNRMNDYFITTIDMTNSVPKLSLRDKEDCKVYNYYTGLNKTIGYIRENLMYAQEYDWEVVK